MTPELFRSIASATICLVYGAWVASSDDDGPPWWPLVLMAFFLGVTVAGAIPMSSHRNSAEVRPGWRASADRGIGDPRSMRRWRLVGVGILTIALLLIAVVLLGAIAGVGQEDFPFFGVGVAAVCAAAGVWLMQLGGNGES